MQTRPKTAPALIAGLIAGLAALAHTPAQAQGLNGQPVDVTSRNPEASTVLADIGTQTVTPAGVTFLDNSKLPAFMTIVVTPTQITFAPTDSANIGFSNGGFKGYDIAETGLSPADITGVSIDPATSVFSSMTGPETFGTDRVTFDAHEVFVNFQSLALDGGSRVTLDIETAPAVPEASTTVSLGLLLVLGLGGIIAARRKKTTAKASA